MVVTGGTLRTLLGPASVVQKQGVQSRGRDERVPERCAGEMAGAMVGTVGHVMRAGEREQRFGNWACAHAVRSLGGISSV